MMTLTEEQHEQQRVRRQERRTEQRELPPRHVEQDERLARRSEVGHEEEDDHQHVRDRLRRRSSTFRATAWAGSIERDPSSFSVGRTRPMRRGVCDRAYRAPPCGAFGLGGFVPRSEETYATTSFDLLRREHLAPVGMPFRARRS